MKYRYITGFINEDFFSSVKAGMEDASRQLGVQVEFTGTDEDDCDVLNALIYEAIEEKYDGIAVNFIHPLKLNNALEACRKAGLPVVSFNMDGEERYRICTVSQQFYKAGRGIGERLADQVAEHAHVLFTQHDSGLLALQERMEGIKSILAKKCIVDSMIISGNTPELARDTIMQYLLQHPKVEWIFCTGQSDTHGAGLAVKSLPERGLKVGGFDLCNEILDMIGEGTIEATVDQQPYVQGFYPLMLLHQYRTKGVRPFDIDTGSAIIDRNLLEASNPEK